MAEAADLQSSEETDQRPIEIIAHAIDSIHQDVSPRLLLQLVTWVLVFKASTKYKMLRTMLDVARCLLTSFISHTVSSLIDYTKLFVLFPSSGLQTGHENTRLVIIHDEEMTE